MTDAPNVPCKVCREEIRRGARKCIQCGSYQSKWKRRLTPESGLALVLSLLATLIAVMGSVGPPLVERLTPKRSDLQVARWDLDRTGVTLAIRNSGNRDGVLGQPAFHLLREEGRQCSEESQELDPADVVLPDDERRFPLLLADRGAGRTVPAAGIIEIPFDLYDGGYFRQIYDRLAIQGAECEVVAILEVRLTEFSGTERQRLWALNAKDVFYLLDR